MCWLLHHLTYPRRLSHRRGKYNREDRRKPISHGEQAWNHLQKVEAFSIGRPCTDSCRYGRKCGIFVTPAVLMAAHQYSYGRKTTCESLAEGTNKYKAEHVKSVTMKRWRDLAASAITLSNDGSRKRVETLTVCKYGPVCQDYWAAAYGIPRGTANLIMAEARSGRVSMDATDTSVMRQLITATRTDDNMAAELAIEWWETWLSMEDQMPNEAAIQHRTVVWQSVYDHEYIQDMEWWGVCRALSRSRWVELRGVALLNLSIQYFGHVEGSPNVPNAMLSLVQRPSHSNFSMCGKCADAKQKWCDFRRCTCRSLTYSHPLPRGAPRSAQHNTTQS